MRVINNRYEIRNLIEKNVDYTKYRVFDMRDQLVKQLVLFEEGSIDKELVNDIVHRFIEYHSFLHTNIQTVYEFDFIQFDTPTSRAKIQYFLTLEDLTEFDQIHYLDLTRTEINSAISQLVRSIQYLHYRGHHHGYINFENFVFIRKQGEIQLKFVDFMRVINRANKLDLQQESTSQFIAPELLWGEKVDASCDIYSLGKIIYYIYYKVDDESKKFDDFAKESNRTPVHQLLTKAANNIREERFSSIHDFMRELESVLWINVLSADLEHFKCLLTEVPIIGRERTVASTLETTMEEYSEKRGVVVYGNTGVGKTRLLREIDHLLRFNGFKTIVSTSEPSNDDEFYFLRRLLLRIINGGYISPDLIHKYGYEISALLPEMAEKWSIKVNVHWNENKKRLRIFNRIASFLLDYCQQNSFVLIIDDVERLSEIERKLVFQFLQNDRKAMTSVILSVSDHDILSKLEGYADSVDVVTLEGLNLEDTGRYISAMLGVKDVFYRLAHFVMRETSGNLSHINEVVKYLYDSKQIYIEDFQWRMNDNIELPYTMQRKIDAHKNITELIDNVNEEELTLLKCASVYRNTFTVKDLSHIYQIEISEIDKMLNLLIEKDILKQQFDDRGLVFAISNPYLKNYLYDALGHEERLALHDALSKIYRDVYSFDYDYEKDLIYHLERSDNELDAINFALDIAEVRMKRGNEQLAVEYLEYANRKISSYHEPELSSRIILLLSTVYSHMANYSKAMVLLNTMIAQEGVYHINAVIDALLQMAHCCYYTNDKAKLESILAQVKRRLERTDYQKGELETFLLDAKLMYMSNDMVKYHNIIIHALDIANESNDLYYQAHFSNELAIYQASISEPDLAVKTFQNSLTYFDQIDDFYEMIRVYNNLGVIYFDSLCKIEEARDYFEKAYNTSMRFNYLGGIPIYLNNIGETYLMEGNYKRAEEYFTRCQELIEETGTRKVLFNCITSLCRTLLYDEQYERSKIILNRLEHEYDKSTIGPREYVDYTLLSLEYNLMMNNILLAEKQRSKFKESDYHLSSYAKVQLAVIDFQMRHKKQNFFKYDKSIDMNQLKGIEKQCTKASEFLLFRDLLITLAYEFLNTEKFLNIKQLLTMDDEYKTMITTPLLDAKRETVEIMLSDNRITKLMEISKNHKIPMNMQWNVFMLLANEHQERGEYFTSLKNYVAAIDVLESLTQNMDVDYKNTFILQDEKKLSIKQSISVILKEISDACQTTTADLIVESEISTIRSFFDLTNIRNIMKCDEFLRVIHEQEYGDSQKLYTSIEMMLADFVNDEQLDMLKILDYLQQKSLAKNAAIMIVNEHNDIIETISRNPRISDNAYDLVNYLKRDSDGILINALDVTKNKHLLTNDLKAILCVPITQANAIITHKDERRRQIPFKKTILGYLYLDSDEILNRFDMDTYKMCQSMINFIYLMVDNYNLKRISIVDKLTMVYTRKYIEDSFSVELLRARENVEKMSVVMLDIDKFKNINDVYGHRKGDEILRELGKILNKSLRKSDYVGRYGGEEFIILLPDTNRDDAYEVCEKVRRAVVEKNMLNDVGDVTISLGVSTYPEDGISEAELIEKADQALYYSKNNGRNQSTKWSNALLLDVERFDKLAGILTGNVSLDSRNIQAMLSIIEKMDANTDRKTVVLDVFKTILDITEANEVKYYGVKRGRVDDVVIVRRGQDNISFENDEIEGFIQDYVGRSTGNYFINWNEEMDVDIAAETPDWRSYIVIPMYLGDAQTGILLLKVKISEKEFDFNTYNFVYSLRNIIAYAIANGK